ncbi:MAG: hypothetical protein RR140_00470 [Clostridia bacterium]
MAENKTQNNSINVQPHRPMPPPRRPNLVPPSPLPPKQAPPTRPTQNINNVRQSPRPIITPQGTKTDFLKTNNLQNKNQNFQNRTQFNNAQQKTGKIKDIDFNKKKKSMIALSSILIGVLIIVATIIVIYALSNPGATKIVDVVN